MTVSEDLVERVARALFDVRWSGIDAPTRDAMWADAREDHRTADDWRNARVAIGAMRSPGDAVLRAMMLALTREHTTNVNLSATWQAWDDGIDAVLSPHTEG